MTEDQEQIERLQTRLDRLVKTQIDFQREVSVIRAELERLRTAKPGLGIPPPTQPVTPPVAPPSYIPPPPIRTEERPQSPTTSVPPTNVPPPGFGMRTEGQRSEQAASKYSEYVSDYVENARGDLEKFIGENLISKIGIIILVVGVGIGAKYAIDNGWISPLLRIVFGYVMGFGLLGLAVKLKAKYLNFSAVLLSGAMAIMYFVTYFAYAYYALMPQLVAFALMVVFTAFTVGAAIFYNRQVIAHIGLVGAYAVPFLLSNNSGNYLALFTYMAVIDAGVLAVSVKKIWRPLFYTASLFTWLIYYSWYVTKYAADQHFYLALIFLAIFFLIFYATKIAHAIIHRGNEDNENLVSIFVTAFIFYSFCLSISDYKTSINDYVLLLSYIGFFSLTILLTSYRFYGRALIYLTYPFTWLIYAGWFLNKYNADEHFEIACIFAAVFFAIFYGTTLIYRLVTDKISMVENAGLVLTNSFVFYGFGYAIIGSRENLQPYQGLFTVAHSAFHSLVAQAVSRFKASAVDVVQVLAVLIITFATIAVPVQFDGNTVTLIWSVEAAALFWFGRARLVRLFEYFSYPIMFLASASLVIDWVELFFDRTPYASEFNPQPILNGGLVTGLVFVAAFAFIYYTNRKEQENAALPIELVRPFGMLIGAIALFVLYNTFRIEIGNYFHLQVVGEKSLHSIASLMESTLTRRVDDIVRFNAITQLNYTMSFLTVLGLLNLKKVRSVTLAYLDAVFGAIILVVFASIGMYLFYELRVSYVLPSEADSAAGPLNIGVRYITYLFAAAMTVCIYLNSRSRLLLDSLPAKLAEIGFDLFLHALVLVTASCELVNLMVQFSIPNSNKYGLSILWGFYALMLVVLGIAWGKKHLRIAAIVLLGVTLTKLFLYDISELGTIPKTFLFVSLGALMLVVSFLYHKYKAFIFKTDAADVKDPV